jgi:hypothetical protein
MLLINAPQITSGEDDNNDSDRSVRQPLVLPSHDCIDLPKARPGFRVIRVSSHNTVPRECLEIVLDLLISKPLLEGGHTQEIGSDEWMLDTIEEVPPPCVVDVTSTQSVKRIVYPSFQEVIGAPEWHLACLPFLEHTP